MDNADNLDIIMPIIPMQFKRDEQNMNNGNPADVTTDAWTSFKYKSSLRGESTAVDGIRAFKYVKIAVPLK